MSPPDGPVFDEPWQAQVFALAVSLQDRGVLDRQDFAETLGAELEDGRDYWDAWLAALEELLTEHGLTDPGSVDERTDAWLRAAAATPHGAPISLDADPRH
ncbi:MULTISPECIES: nitrile hydratase accessory protein [unclassified Pseudonocardia]|uniref:nitrile hydratase accessory protein n=1 Tax=unclassified Pseudonocardia TaxID=2619320 RepID=UPI000492AEC8|nr:MULTISPECIES: nitrile hydratase accessory protein [unclassified Pseudonocardia]ALE75024.1 nitrile hydratase [Pseudonocardia sp. EC080625-04]OLM16415.1 putative metal chaperone, involved in Fe-nitrile hydratase activation, GTPase of COG0523 family [Pseudonocardia sp. Ae707_Ps1]